MQFTDCTTGLAAILVLGISIFLVKLCGPAVDSMALPYGELSPEVRLMIVQLRGNGVGNEI